MRFEFFPLRFEFIARDSLYFAPGMAANTLRGALGTIFRRIAPTPDIYARLFEPTANGTGPSGLADSPRPFVFRARHLDGKTIHPEQPFYFDLHVFPADQSLLGYFIQSFREIAQEGIGPRRGRAELQRVLRINTNGDRPETVSDSTAPEALDLSCRSPAPQTIRVAFLSPTELKHRDGIAERPDFAILCGRLRDRISTLRSLYGPGPLDIDFQKFGQRAASVEMIRCDVRRVESRRRSTRTGQTHALSGFVGTADYQGDLGEFLPYLTAGQWLGVGRQAVWGKGEIGLM
jgi:hypothetical protein